MDKAEVVTEIQRLAAESGGAAPGLRRFCVETGLQEHEIVGRLWPRWGDALAEAGFTANVLNPPMDEDALLGSYVSLARSLGHAPTSKELRYEAGTKPGFPHPTTFTRRYGGMGALRDRVRVWCQDNPGNDDVLAMLPEPLSAVDDVPDESDGPLPAAGFVYLVRSGRHYKIGRSNNSGRRSYELSIQLPDPLEVVHTIKTDDPAGLEAYWHRRFDDRRKGGEWFDLRRADVDAFKRWRRIY